MNVCPLLAEHLDNGPAAYSLRLCVFDVVHPRSQEALVRRNDAVFHKLRGQPSVVPTNTHYRDIDVGKNVSGSALQDDRRHQHNHQRGYDERVRPRERNPDDPHASTLDVPGNFTASDFASGAQTNCLPGIRVDWMPHCSNALHWFCNLWAGEDSSGVCSMAERVYSVSEAFRNL